MSEHPKVTWRGWPGHFICSSRCVFHLNTLIEHDDIKIIVSTVGMMMKRDGENAGTPEERFDTVGHDRYFETMAFHAHKEGEFWDADVSREIPFSSEWSWQLDEEWKANKGHYAVIEEICDGLEHGLTYGRRQDDA